MLNINILSYQQQCRQQITTVIYITYIHIKGYKIVQYNKAWQYNIIPIITS